MPARLISGSPIGASGTSDSQSVSKPKASMATAAPSSASASNERTGGVTAKRTFTATPTMPP